MARAVHSPATYPVFSPHSPYARSIANLSSIVLWTMLAIFVVVILAEIVVTTVRARLL